MLNHLSAGVFDDEDAVYVRFTDADGAVVHDQLSPTYEPVFATLGHREPFRQHYARLMQRDTTGMLTELEAFKQRVAQSRYRDFAQAWSDVVDSVLLRVVPAPATSAARARVVFQDRLRDENHQHDTGLAYALATVVNQGGNVGTVLVAFNMEGTQRAVRGKYLKFAAMAVFFLALMVVQSVFSRRNKLRLMDLQANNARAKQVLMDALPGAPLLHAPWGVAGALNQALGPVDGMVWDVAPEDGGVLLMAVDPDGDGIDAAAVGLFVLQQFRQRRRDGIKVPLEEEAAALGQTALSIPLSRPVGLVLCRAHSETGVVDILTGSFATPRVLHGHVNRPPDACRVVQPVPDGLVGPLQLQTTGLETGGALVVLCAGMGRKDPHVEAGALGQFLLRAHPDDPAAMSAVDGVTWARGRNPLLSERDLAVLMLWRSA
jgi:hypothetical protein